MSYRSKLYSTSSLNAHAIVISNVISQTDKSLLAQAQSNAPNFEDWYLKQVTKEFADDIDKIRNAGDFSDKSVPILVAALKQGASLFSEKERRTVMGTHPPKEK